MWEIEATDQFVEWWEDLSLPQQMALEARVELLAEQGPSGVLPWSGSRPLDTTT